ncbi:hypothetical protein KJ618_03980, partial [Patescibacteria group bacterium]|nr:hypothetical protein [Patescibacteria group bacterium]
SHMPPNAKVIIFDDDEHLRNTVKEVLNSSSHQVIGEAGSIEELEILLAQLDVSPTVFLLDNQAPWRPGESSDYKGVGHAARNRVKDRFGDQSIIVAFTSSEDTNYGDVNFNPSEQSLRKNLSEFITSLRHKES